MEERRLPSLERERANAAYVWVKSCQGDLVSALGTNNAGYSGEWAKIQWCYRRLEQAVALMGEAEAAVGLDAGSPA